MNSANNCQSASPVGLFVTIDRVLVHADDQARKLLVGCSDRSLQGKTVDELLPADLLPSPNHQRCVISHADGREIGLEIQSISVQLAGREASLFAVRRGATFRKQGRNPPATPRGSPGARRTGCIRS